MKTSAFILIMASTACQLATASPFNCNWPVGLPCAQTTTTTTTSKPCQCSTSSSTICNACPSCGVYPLQPLDIQEKINISPLFVFAEASTKYSQNYVSQCLTLLQIDYKTDIFFVCTTSSDGTVSVQSYFGITGPQGSGSFEYVGLAGTNFTGGIIFYSYLISTSCCGSSTIYNFKQTVLAQDCSKLGDQISPYILASTSLDPDPQCVSDAKKSLTQASGNAAFITLSNCPMNCVSKFKGITVANYDKISKNSRINGIEI